MACVCQGAVGRHPKPPQHLIESDDVGCRGGSLPNVKFASNNSIDLQVVVLCSLNAAVRFVCFQYCSQILL